jgi:isoquinoline 1-oxidoreductase alpha subunit
MPMLRAMSRNAGKMTFKPFCYDSKLAASIERRGDRFPAAMRPLRLEDAMYEIDINGQKHSVAVEPGTPLLWVLRDTLAMTGTKYGCGIAQCGACTVLVDGAAMRSCQFPVERVGKAKVTTIEAIEQDEVGRKVVEAWVGVEVPQCGYCQSGQVMAATALLKETPKPTDEDIVDAMSNLCRCGTYNAIAAAVRRAAA